MAHEFDERGNLLRRVEPDGAQLSVTSAKAITPQARTTAHPGTTMRWVLAR